MPLSAPQTRTWQPSHRPSYRGREQRCVTTLPHPPKFEEILAQEHARTWPTRVQSRQSGPRSPLGTPPPTRPQITADLTTVTPIPVGNLGLPKLPGHHQLTIYEDADEKDAFIT